MADVRGADPRPGSGGAPQRGDTRTNRWRVVALVAGWLVVVAVVTTAVWATISSVQDEPVRTERPVPATTGGVPGHQGGDEQPQPSGTGGDQTGTWQERGGVVVAACDQATVRLVSAQPADGHRVEIDEDGPDELEVTFEGRGHRAREITVVVRCESGAPVFTTTTDD